MTNLISFGEEGKPEILIDADSIQMIEFCDDTMGPTFGDSKGITLWSKESGVFARLDAKDASAADEIIGKICGRKAESWVKFPVRWPDSDTNENTLRSVCYIDPTTFTYAITSVPSECNNEKIGPTRAILLGVDGYGRLESTAVTAEEERAMLDAIKTANQHLIEVPPSEASARFYNPGYTLYDPAKVNRIYGDGIQVNVIFNQRDRVDFTLRHVLKAQTGPKADINEHMQRMLADGKDEEAAMRAIEELLRDQKKQKEAREQTVRNDFARAVAAKCPHLNEIENASYPVFMRFNNIASIYAHDDGKAITVHYRKTKGEQYDETQNVYFTEADALKKALEKLKSNPPHPGQP